MFLVLVTFFVVFFVSERHSKRHHLTSLQWVMGPIQLTSSTPMPQHLATHSAPSLQPHLGPASFFVCFLAQHYCEILDLQHSDRPGPCILLLLLPGSALGEFPSRQHSDKPGPRPFLAVTAANQRCCPQQVVVRAAKARRSTCTDVTGLTAPCAAGSAVLPLLPFQQQPIWRWALCQRLKQLAPTQLCPLPILSATCT
jgi:hypothetical protein